MTDVASQLAGTSLGDLVVLPDGSRAVVRVAVRRLGASVGSMGGFVLAGEFGPDCRLLSIPARAGDNVVVFSPRADLPASARGGTRVTEGVASYWAPHLPMLSGAMAEVSFRVVKAPGSLEPIVLMWLGAEMIVFTFSYEANPQRFSVKALPVDASRTEGDVARVASTVTSPAHAPAPAAPLHAPAYR